MPRKDPTRVYEEAAPASAQAEGEDIDAVLAASAPDSAGSSAAADAGAPTNQWMVSLWALLLPAPLLAMFAVTYVLRSPTEAGALAAAWLLAAALLRPSLAGVARRRFEAARAAPAVQRAATRGGWNAAAAGEAAVYFSCFAHALAYLGGFLLLYTQTLPFSQRLFELAILSEPAVVTATTVLAPAAVLWTQSQSSKRFGLGF